MCGGFSQVIGVCLSCMVMSPCMLFVRSTCQMSRADELFVNIYIYIYILCFCIIYELFVIGDNKTWLLLSWKVFFL